MQPRILAIHTMKTGGTSLRRAMASVAGLDGIYPSDEDLAELPNRWYPGPRDLLDTVEDPQRPRARVVIGHLPYVFADAMTPRPKVVTVVREPVARTISIIEHRRRRSPDYSDASYDDMLDQDHFVERQVRDYQTKVFALDSLEECPDHVNVALEIDDDRFQRALTRLEQVDVLGLTEDMPDFLDRLATTFGLSPIPTRRDNQGTYEAPSLSESTRRRIEEVTVRDRILYARAKELVAAQQQQRSGPAAALRSFVQRLTGRR